MTYEDTFEACGNCESGTLVTYPDGTTKCRYCGEPKTKEAAKTVAGRKTNG